MGVPHPRKYTAEFKRQAVALAKELGSAPKAAERLGVPESNIHNWREKLKAGSLASSPGNGDEAERSDPNVESPEQELRRLRKELERERKVNQILKQAAAFFSQDHLK